MPLAIADLIFIVNRITTRIEEFLMEFLRLRAIQRLSLITQEVVDAVA